jgi:hypothetical protein
MDGRLMENGEKRFRFKMPDGTAYIRTEAGEVGAWQNAHHHKGVRETYIVQDGWMAYAECRNDAFYFEVCGEGRVFTSEPGIDHNVFLPAGAVIHTVQHGHAVGNPEKKNNDWFPSSAEFDEWSKSIGIDALILRGAWR